MKTESSYYEIIKDWPEGFASLTIERLPNSSAWHTDIYKGKTTKDFLSNFRITNFLPGHLPDMLPNNLGWPIVSARCCKRFATVDANVKATLYPIKDLPLDSCPAVLSSYSLLSASLVLDCLDLTSQDIDWFDDSRQLASAYTKLRFDASKIPERVSFFSIKRLPCVHIISGELRRSLEMDRIEGFKFAECDLSKLLN